MMFGDNKVKLDHKKDGWYTYIEYTDKRIFGLLEYMDKIIEMATTIENKHNNGDSKKKR